MPTQLKVVPTGTRKKRKRAENFILRESPGLTRQEYKRDRHKATVEFLAKQFENCYKNIIAGKRPGIVRKHLQK